MFYDIGEGLTFATPAMQSRFFEWLKIYDEVEHTNFHQEGPPRVFAQLSPLLRRFFLHAAEEKSSAERGVTLVLGFPEKLVPAAEESSARMRTAGHFTASAIAMHPLPVPKSNAVLSLES